MHLFASWLRVTHLCIRMIKCNISLGNLMEEGLFSLNETCMHIQLEKSNIYETKPWENP